MANVDYIDKPDYTISISIENLQDVIEQGIEATSLTEKQLLDNSELTAQAEIRAYLIGKYDVDKEFAKNFSTIPDEREKLTLRCVVNLSLYNLHMTINPRDIPEKIMNAYEQCLENLDAARRGELILELDPPQDQDGNDADVQWRQLGSNYKFTSKPFHEARLIEGESDVVPPVVP